MCYSAFSVSKSFLLQDPDQLKIEGQFLAGQRMVGVERQG
jgi:hypothetical protein